MKQQIVNPKDYPNGMVIRNAVNVVWIGAQCVVTGDDAEVSEQA